MTTSVSSQHRIEASYRRIRVLFGGQWIVDTQDAKYVWETRFYGLYYFPISILPEKYLEDKQETEEYSQYTIVVGSKKSAAGALKIYKDDRAGLFNIKFDAADAWFEEEEEIAIHPKDPYKRVDVLQSSRHIRVEVDGVEVANTRKPRLLFETLLITRTYIPKTDCRLDLLVPSDLRTGCPYKGEANYYHVQLSPNDKKENIVWWYRNPTLECAPIKGYLAFYDEKVDVWVDGVKQVRPSSGVRD